MVKVNIEEAASIVKRTSRSSFRKSSKFRRWYLLCSGRLMIDYYFHPTAGLTLFIQTKWKKKSTLKRVNVQSHSLYTYMCINKLVPNCLDNKLLRLCNWNVLKVVNESLMCEYDEQTLLHTLKEQIVFIQILNRTTLST